MEESKVDHPLHYNQTPGGIECIEAMEQVFGTAEVYDFCLLNAFKYLWRCQAKDDMLEDLEKADWYLQRAIKYEKKRRHVNERL